MERLNRQSIEKALLEAALVPVEKQVLIFNEQNRTGKSLARILIEKGLLDEETAVSILEELLNIPLINLYNFKINENVVDSIPAEMARRYRIMPAAIREDRLYLAMADPLDLTAIDDAAMVTGLEIRPVVAGEKAISYAIDHYYELAGNQDRDQEGSAGKDTVRETEATTATMPASGEAPVVKLVDSLIGRAIEEEASDIHLEPTGEGLRIRMRLDGVLQDLAVPPRFKPAQIVSRIKIMANLDIAEKRLAQDGNIHHRKEGREINLRVSTMPTVHGEKVVIRLLDKNKIILPLDRLGFSPDNLRAFQRLLLNQSGMILVTGPTGCGKTTTLYSALHYLNNPSYNIITVEDPVEYRLNGINQVPVDRRINRTFANALRSILRQDPDIIMVGEIRDPETVKIASQAALTGHLVLSTLHTNNAAGAVTRLSDMGLEPFMVTASTVGIVAQRLIRRICPHCTEEFCLKDEEKVFYARYFNQEPPQSLHRGAGCKRCSHTGFRGRTSIQEILVVGQELQALILNRSPAVAIHNKAVELGMQPLLSGALRCVEEGVTTLGEAVRATFNSLLDDQTAGFVENSCVFSELQQDD